MLNKTTIHELSYHDLSKEGLVFSTSFLEDGPILWEELRHILTRQPGKFFSYLPRNTSVDHENLFWMSLSSSGVTEAQIKKLKLSSIEFELFKSLLCRKQTCVALFTVGDFSVDEVKNWSSAEFVVKCEDVIYTIIRANNDVDWQGTLFDESRHSGVSFRCLGVVGEWNLAQDMISNTLVVTKKRLKEFVSTIGFVSFEAWDGEGRIFWLSEDWAKTLQLPDTL